MQVRFVALSLVLIQAMLTSSTFASTITVGETLPFIRIDEIGECVIDGKDTAFQPWDSGRMQGKVQVFEYLAARAGIDEVHRLFFEAIGQAAFPGDRFAVTRVVNSDDALWGTSGLVSGEIKKNKLQTPDTVLVVDAEGLGLKQWKLKEKNAALAILDQKGKVLFFKQGPLTEKEISTGIALIRQHLSDQ